MLSRPLAFAVLAAGCMAAAAGGAYLAMRQEPAEVLPVATAAAPATAELLAGPTASPATAEGVPTLGEPPVVAERATGPEPEAAPRVSERRAAAVRPDSRRRRSASTTTKRERASASAVREPAPAEPIEALPFPASDAASETPTEPQVTEIVVPAETVIGVQVNTTVSSDRARVEDRVEGRVTRDVTVDDRLAIPAGARLLGAVTLVEPGGKFRERARIAVRFHTLVLNDGARVPMSTTAIVREGESPARETAAKVGGSAVGGAIIGAILGGAKGAVIGGTAGAGAGTAIVAAGDRNPATLPAGTQVSIRLMSDVVMTVAR